MAIDLKRKGSSVMYGQARAHGSATCAPAQGLHFLGAPDFQSNITEAGSVASSESSWPSCMFQSINQFGEVGFWAARAIREEAAAA
jgi:hypothetical protein